GSPHRLRIRHHPVDRPVGTGRQVDRRLPAHHHDLPHRGRRPRHRPAPQGPADRHRAGL
ncbi:MAG: hypothetical protein AVDCRST_MAG38-3078, partial [uncultured Solirubrobacteraceae bacterium]